MPLIGRRRWPAAIACVLAAGVAHAQAGEKEQCAVAAEEAQALRDAGKLIDARARLVRCAQSACPAFVRNDCAGWLARSDDELPTVVVRARDEEGRDLVDVRVFVDGKPALTQLDGRALPLDPGKHVLRYEAEGLPPVEAHVLIALGEKNRALLVVFPGPRGGAPARPTEATSAGSEPREPRAPTSSTPWLGYGLLALGAAGAVSFGVFEVIGQNRYATLHDGCAKTHSCEESSIDAARSWFVAAGVSLAVAVVGLGVGGVVLFTSKGSASGAAVEVGPAELRARVRF
jgi:hypothetical protein